MRRRTLRALLIVVMLAGVTTGLVFFLATERSSVFGLEPAREAWAQNRETTLLTLTFKEFRPALTQFAGEAKVEIYPRDVKDSPALSKSLKETWLQFEHFIQDHYLVRGGVDGPLTLESPELSHEMTAKKDFTWTATALRSAFYYPFDSYSLDFNPMMMDRGSGDSYPIRRISNVTLDFTNSNFVATAEATGRVGASEDPYVIHLTRSPLARTATAVAIALMALWLAYLIAAKSGVENVGGLLTLFLGVFSIRSALLSGAPLLPCAIDYVCLMTYAGAVLILLIKWLLPDSDKKTCPHCASEIALQANVCPFCTRDAALAG